ncbi:MAG: hypothetical protein ACXW2Y_11800 [Acidimicrobiia bacterium]
MLMVVLLISGLKLLAASDASVLVTAGIAVAVGIVVAARAMRHPPKVPTPPQ